MISSLQNLCGIPSLVVILNHPHLKKEIFCSPINENNFKERNIALQRAVSEFLRDFHLVLKKFTPKQLIPLIGFEMWKWAEYQKKYFNLPLKFSKNFIKSSFFTSKGVIDEEKPARKLLMEPSLSDFLKYSIACHYFLEDVIPSLWQTLQKNERNFRKMLKEHKSPMPMQLWYDYLKEMKKTVSELSRKDITRNFKIRVFSYGLKHRNVAAIKFSLSSKGVSEKDKTEANIIRKLVYKSFCDYVSLNMKKLTGYFVSSDYLFVTAFLADRKIILYFISLLNKKELSEFFSKCDFSFEIFKLVLLWPYQNEFMDFADIFFENFCTYKYHELMVQILSLIDDQHVCESYNYRLLLREFWIKSPSHMKKEIINSESNTIFDNNLIQTLFELGNFTSDDLANFNLILENANLEERQNILLNQGNEICITLIVYDGMFGLADLFLKNLDLNQETLQTFKKEFAFDAFIEIMEEQNIDLVDKIFKWVVGSDDIDDFKEEIFQRLILSDKIEHFFLDLKEKTPFSFLNKIIRWFLKTDERIEEWKNIITYSPLIEYVNSGWIDVFLKYQGHSEEEASVIKREILFRNLPGIAKCFLNYDNEGVIFNHNIFYLCSLKTEKLIEFTDHLHSFYEDSIKQKMCLLCLNDNHVLGDGANAQLICQIHATNGFISLYEVDRICSCILKKLNIFLRYRESVLLRD